MANEKHVEILKLGWEVWNEWRMENPDVRPDLTEANLEEANLDYAGLYEADLRKANLHRASLVQADLRKADLRESTLVSANLGAAILEEAKLNGANLQGARFINTETLKDADFDGAIIGYTTFANIALWNAKNLDKVIHEGRPSWIGFETIFESEGRIPKEFLRECGFNDLHIEVAELSKLELDADQVHDISREIYRLYVEPGAAKYGIDENKYFSCFISYSRDDSELAKRLYIDLDNRKVDTFLDEKDIEIAENWKERIKNEIIKKDKILVILSSNSIASEYVEEEISAAFELGKGIIPVKLDKAIYDTNIDWAVKIRKLDIGDFSEWEDELKYRRTFSKILKSLKLENK